jgi:hypothetical protein
VELIDLGSQDKIALRQAVDLVRPGRDLDSSPSKKNVWVVALVLRELAYASCKLESFAKVGKLKDLGDVMFFDDAPPVEFGFAPRELKGSQR